MADALSLSIKDLQALSLRLGEGGAEAFLAACARAPDGNTNAAAPSAAMMSRRLMCLRSDGNALSKIERTTMDCWTA